MIVQILYQPDSEHARVLEEYARDFAGRSKAKKVLLVSLSTREGYNLASLYDIVRYPAVLVTTDIGGFIKSWQGKDEVPPTVDELLGYVNQ